MSKYNVYVEDVSVEAVFNKVGGVEGAKMLLRDELMISKPERAWREQDGAIHFSVTSDGMTGEEWIARLGSKGFHVSEYTKQLLRSLDFKPTDGVTHEITVLKGMLFSDGERVTKKIRKEAARRNLTTPNAEIACLIREKFSDEDLKAMGLWWIIIMHEPIKDSDGAPDLLRVLRLARGRWLNAYYVSLGNGWSREGGFAFVSSQV